MYKKDVWPDIHPDSWFTLQFSQLALKHSPNLRSFGLTRTLTRQPVLASIPLQEKDTLLPAAASYEQNPQCHFHRPVLALPAASWPSPRQRPCACISQVRSRMPETFSFASFQSPEMKPLDAPIVWLCCSSKEAAFSSGILRGPWTTNVLFEGNYECVPQRKKAPLALWSLPWQFQIGFFVY